MELDEFLALKRGCEAKRRQADRSQVLFEQAQAKLRGLGFDSEEEAESRLKELEREIRLGDKEFARALASYREKYDD